MFVFGASMWHETGRINIVPNNKFHKMHRRREQTCEGVTKKCNGEVRECDASKGFFLGLFACLKGF